MAVLDLYRPACLYLSTCLSMSQPDPGRQQTGLPEAGKAAKYTSSPTKPEAYFFQPQSCVPTLIPETNTKILRPPIYPDLPSPAVLR
jgi:hypothetical protein